MRRFPALLLSLIAAAALAEPVQRPHIEVELIAEKSALHPGEPATFALRLKMEKHWHTYWKNPGDSGLPTKIVWTLPPGFEAGPIQWPVPRRINIGPLTNFGYEDEILLLTEIRIPRDLVAGTMVPIAARADWLVCEEICIPGNAGFSLMLPVGNPALDPKWAAAIARTRTGLPQPLEGWNISARLRGGDLLIGLQDGHTDASRIRSLIFFPDEDGWIENAAAQRMIRTSGGYELRVASAAAVASKSGPLSGLLVGDPGLGGHVAAALVVTPLGKGAGPAANEIGEKTRRSPVVGLGLLAALGLALAGGVILNLMPCVFPLVSIKALGFVEQARGSAAKLRAHGLTFGAGVLLSFWAVAGTLLLLRARGEALGWGFQLQSPPMVAALALLFFVLALNLSGLYQVGASLQSIAGGLRLRDGYADSFLSGLLATLVATPCTAPFMGAALGYALARPAFEAMLVFSGLAVGMASPYLLLCFSPGLIRRLPHPGPWMETLKRLLAIPLYLTVLWLAWVLGKQAGTNATMRLFAGLALIAAALWVAGFRRDARTRTAATLIALLLAVSGLIASWPGNVTVEAVAEEAEGAWKPWSETAVSKARAAGKAVFVEFTAAWCVTCQVNKRLVLESDAVETRFAESGIVRLRADWTNQDAAITAALKSLGRSGVPVYAVYAPGGDGTPILLPELLTRERVLRAIDEAIAPTS